MRPSPLFRLSLGLFLCGCSLSLENPEQDAKNKVAKPVPTTMEALVGRWKADSTYTVDDTRALVIKQEPVWLEIFADTSYSRSDTSRLAFDGSSDGACYRSGDTLITFPTNSSSSPDTFLVRLSFLGNYLQLHHLADQRFTFFHKIKPRDSAAQSALLRDSLWRMQGRRLEPGLFKAETYKEDFAYLRFSGDSMYADVRRNGVARFDSGILARSGSKWTWKAASGDREFLADLVKDDSLRLWPLTGGRPDSGYIVYVRASRRHPLDVDMRPLLGHMRCDSIFYPLVHVENHYGRYYDWTLTEDHKVAVETNMPDVPRFASWTLDSGTVAMDGPGIDRVRFTVASGEGPGVLMAQGDNFFGNGTRIFQTKVDPARFAADPLERFETASYLRLVVAGDTLDYFFNGNNLNERFDIARIVSDSVYWSAITLSKDRETFQSSQPGFFFAFQARNAALGRYACRSRPEKDLVIRQAASGNPLMAQGQVQGACQVLNAETPTADTVLTVEGSFRLKRRSYGSLASHAWTYQ
jgi:hypothetical protein